MRQGSRFFHFCTSLPSLRTCPPLPDFSNFNLQNLLNKLHCPIYPPNLNENIAILQQLHILKSKRYHIIPLISKIESQLKDNTEDHIMLGSLWELLENYQKQDHFRYFIEDHIRDQRLAYVKPQVFSLLEFIEIQAHLSYKLSAYTLSIEDIYVIIKKSENDALMERVAEYIERFDLEAQQHLLVAMVRQGFQPQSWYDHQEFQGNLEFIEIMNAVEFQNQKHIGLANEFVMGLEKVTVKQAGVLVKFLEGKKDNDILISFIQKWEGREEGSFSDLRLIIEKTKDCLNNGHWDILDRIGLEALKQEPYKETISFFKFLEAEVIIYIQDCILKFTYLLAKFLKNYEDYIATMEFEDLCYTYIILIENYNYFKEYIEDEQAFQSQMEYIKVEELQNSVTSIILDIDYKYDYDSYLDRLLNLVELNEFFENDGY